MRPLSEDVRRRIVSACLGGHTEVARVFGVCKRSVERFLRQQRESGGIGAKQVGGYWRSRLEGHQKQIKRWIKGNNEMTLAELRELIRERLQIEISTTALWHRLEALDLNFKKTRRAAEQDRPDVREAPKSWRLEPSGWHPGHLVFLDETGLNTKMVRLYGRSPGLNN